MSGNSSRKYKQYMELQQRIIDYGNIEMRDEYGITDLVAFGASRGRAVIQSQSYKGKQSNKGKKKT